MPVITYTITDEPLTQVRLHIKTCSVLDSARYYRLLRDANTWVQERLGHGLGEMTDEEQQTMEENGTLPIFRIAQNRAEMLAALDRVESLNGDGEWHPGALPAEWDDLEGFAEKVPWMLHLAWREAVKRANPGLFAASDAEDEKKSGYVSVTW
jgi:hypothetical protein